MQFSKRVLGLVILFAVYTVVAQCCFGQTFSSSIAGVVTDPSGSVVQGAKVHLQNMGTDDVRDTTTTTAGIGFPQGGGCSSTGFQSMWLALPLLGLFALRRRRLAA